MKFRVSTLLWLMVFVAGHVYGFAYAPKEKPVGVQVQVYVHLIVASALVMVGVSGVIASLINGGPDSRFKVWANMAVAYVLFAILLGLIMVILPTASS